MLLDGAIKAYSRVGLMLNVRRDDLAESARGAACVAQSHRRRN